MLKKCAAFYQRGVRIPVHTKMIYTYYFDDENEAVTFTLPLPFREQGDKMQLFFTRMNE